MGVTSSGKVLRYRSYEIKEGKVIHFTSVSESVNCVTAGFINRGSQCVTDDFSEKLGKGMPVCSFVLKTDVIQKL